MVNAQLKGWLVADMVGRLPASASCALRVYSKNTVKVVANNGLQKFTDAEWAKHLQSSALQWQTQARPASDVRKKRRGGSQEELDLWRHIRAKRMRGNRPTVWCD